MAHAASSPARKKFPYYPLYVDDFDLSERVAAMTLAEVGLYLLCLNRSWRNGSIPNDPDKVAALVSKPVALVRRAWPAVSGCFQETAPGRLTNARQEEERQKVIAKSEQATEAIRSRYARTTSVPTSVDSSVYTGVLPRASESVFVSLSDSEKKKKEESMKFRKFWARYSKLRDAGRQQIAAQMWLSLDCEEHAEQVFACLASYEASRDAQNGTVMNADLWLRTVHESGWTATWPAKKKSRLDQMAEEASAM